MGCGWGPHPMYDAAARGKLDTLRRMHELGAPINKYVYFAAAAARQEAVMEWLEDVGADRALACKAVLERCADGAYTSSSKLSQELQQAIRQGGVLVADDVAAMLTSHPAMADDEGLWKVLSELSLDFSTLDPSALSSLWCNVLCECSSVDVPKRLRAGGVPFHAHALVAAIDHLPNVLETARWMIDHGCPVSGRALYAACSLGCQEKETRTLQLLNLLDKRAGQAAWAHFSLDDDSQDYFCDFDRYWSCSQCGDAAIEAGSIGAPGRCALSRRLPRSSPLPYLPRPTARPAHRLLSRRLSLGYRAGADQLDAQPCPDLCSAQGPP